MQKGDTMENASSGEKRRTTFQNKFLDGSKFVAESSNTTMQARGKSIEQESTPSPCVMGRNHEDVTERNYNLSSDLPDSIKRDMLTAAGWKVNQSLRKIGKKRWYYRTPKIAKDLLSPRVFSSLSAAMSYFYETAEIDATSLTSPASTERKKSSQDGDNQKQKIGNVVNQESCNGATEDGAVSTEPKTESNPSSEKYLQLSDDEARRNLKLLGWEITKLTSKGKSRWIYKPPETHTGLSSPKGVSSAKVFKTLWAAIEEYNRGIHADQEDNGQMKKVTFGLARKRHSNLTLPGKIKRRKKSTSESSETPIMENFCNTSLPEDSGFKNIELFAEMESVAIGDPVESTSDCLHLPGAGEVTPVQPIQNNFTVVGKTQLQHDSPTCENKRCRWSKCNPGARISLNRLQIKLNDGETRDQLRAAGWEVDQIRPNYKNACEWVFKAPSNGSDPGGKFYSLCSAISEYNRRIRHAREDSLEGKATIVLLATDIQATPIAEASPVATGFKNSIVQPTSNETMNTSCYRENVAASKQDAPLMDPGRREWVECGFEPEADETEVDIINASCPGNTISSSPPDHEKPLRVPASAARDDVNLTCHDHTEKPFGALVGDIIEDDRGYLMQVCTGNFGKESLRVIVENDYLTIKTKYGMESTTNKFPAKYSGAFSCRFTLPTNVARESIAASQLKPGYLYLTLPKIRGSRWTSEVLIK